MERALFVFEFAASQWLEFALCVCLAGFRLNWQQWQPGEKLHKQNKLALALSQSEAQNSPRVMRFSYRSIVQVVQIVLAAVDVLEQLGVVLEVKEDGRGAEVERLSAAAAAVREHVQLGGGLKGQREVAPDPVEERQHLQRRKGQFRSPILPEGGSEW